ncbi:MAG: hypothetical protein K8S20_04720 [Chloroflexi bacterium]|nr:hypothetical protein [Chloroflexota bacterium]
MDEEVITLGSITVRKRPEESYQSQTTSRKVSLGKIIPFHVTDEKIDILIAYAIFINHERDIRTLEVQKEFNTFGRLKHGLRLSILPTPDDLGKFYIELKQAIPKNSFEKHETLHPTRSELDLDEGAKLSVFGELRKLGADVGTKHELIGDVQKTSTNLCACFPKDNIWVPIAAYITTRILPMSLGYQGWAS